MRPDGQPRLRQVVVATSSRDRVVEALRSKFGLGVSHWVDDAPSHAEFGLRAAHLPVGDQFIEVVEPKRPDVPVGRHLARMGGDGGYMVILQIPSLEDAARRVREQGARIIWEGGDAVRAIHIHPHDAGGTLLSLAQDMQGDAWAQAGEGWRSHIWTDVVCGMSVAEIACHKPARWADRWSALLGVERSGDEGFTLQLGDTSLRFVATVAQPHGPSGLTFTPSCKAAVSERTMLKIGQLDIRLG